MHATACTPHDRPYDDQTVTSPSRGTLILFAQVTGGLLAHVNNGRPMGHPSR